MVGTGPFLAIRAGGPPRGFHGAPPGGFCVNVFVFVRRGGELLLGRMRPHPAWMDLAGADEARVRLWSRGWTVPGTQLLLGEHPRDGARRILTGILQLPGLEPTSLDIHAEHEPHPDLAGLPAHFDLSFHYTFDAPAGLAVPTPEWYEALAFHDLGKLAPAEYGRQHQDVVAQWRTAPRR